MLYLFRMYLSLVQIDVCILFKRLRIMPLTTIIINLLWFYFFAIFTYLIYSIGLRYVFIYTACLLLFLMISISLEGKSIEWNELF